MAQKILEGIGALFPEIAGRKVFLVRDSSFPFLAIRNELTGVAVAEFSDFTPNPLYEEVEAGIRAFLVSGADTILAVGGGSTIDVAKCIKLYCKSEPGHCFLEDEKTDTGVKLIAIPTTAGTGSESTRHAVIYYQGVKQSVSHPSIVPDVAVLEPGVLKTLPAYQKKCTMLDALCQAVESWWSVGSTEESIGYSRRAVALIEANWQPYFGPDGGEKDRAAARILEAANLAGRAINITATTAAHAMSYKLTSLYHLPHGHAVAVCMPEVWHYLLEHPEKCNDPRGEAHLRQVLGEIPVTVEWFEDLLKQLEIGQPVSAEREKDLEVLASSVNPERLRNYPAALDEETLFTMYGRIVREEAVSGRDPQRRNGET